MSLQTRLAALATAIGGDIKALFSRSLPAGGATGQVLAKTSETDYAVGWTTPSDASPKISVGTTAPSNPSVGDIWVDTN